VVAGIGWFAVNSVSGALALATLTDLPSALCLIIVVVLQVVIAFFGHNLVQTFERYAFPVLAVIFLITSVVILGKATPSAVAGGAGGIGGFLHRDTRYRQPDRDVHQPRAHGRRGSDAGGIALGAICANAINIYSGSMSFLALGVNVPLGLLRAHRVRCLRRARIPAGAVRAERRRQQVRELPADHLVLDRAVARGLPRRLVPAPRQAGGRVPVRQVLAAVVYAILFQFQRDKDIEEAAVVG
jgi:hypothetical protein